MEDIGGVDMNALAGQCIQLAFVQLHGKSCVAAFDIGGVGTGASDQEINDTLGRGEFVTHACVIVKMVGKLLQMKNSGLGKDQGVHDKCYSGESLSTVTDFFVVLQQPIQDCLTAFQHIFVSLNHNRVRVALLFKQLQPISQKSDI